MVAMLLAGSPVLTLALLLAFGICLVPSNIAGVSAMTSWFGRQARGTAVGIRQAGVSTGGVLAALVFPLIVTTFGWRGTFAVAGCVAALIVLVAVYWYRDPAGPVNRKSPTWRDLVHIARDRHFALVAIIGMIMLGLQYTTLAHVAVFLHGRRHETILLTGELLAAAQVAGIGGRIGWGLLSDRAFRGRRLPVLRLILIVSAFACLDLALLGNVQSGLGWLPVMAATGVAILGWPTVYLALIAELAPVGEAAAAIGIGLAIALIGGVIGPSLFGLVVDVSHTYDLAWLMLAAAALIGLFISRFVRERAESAIDLKVSAAE
jgi:sugar phosphate permease